MEANTTYWNNEGACKTFTHAIDSDWLNDLHHIHQVLDFGCGYGRLTPDLFTLGPISLDGYDFSEPLIHRAKQENPGPTYSSHLNDFQTKKYDLITCFAVFTCCPADEEQLDIVTWLNSVTSVGSYLYISDYIIEENPAYHNRYHEQELGIYGCFRSGMATFRHHPRGHFERILPAWHKVKAQVLTSHSLHGNSVAIHQYLFTKI